MTYSDFAAYIRAQTGTNATTFPDTKLLLYANIYKDELARLIVHRKQDIFGVPETTDLQVDVSNNPVREYPMPDDSFDFVKHVEAKLDGTNWLELGETDLSDSVDATDETTIIAKFANVRGQAKYDIFRGSLWLYTGTFGAVSGGLKIWTFQWPAAFTDLTLTTDMSIAPSSTSGGFPREFHELLARRVIIAYKTQGDKPMQLTDNEKKFDQDLMVALDNLVPPSELFALLPEEPKMDSGFNL